MSFVALGANVAGPFGPPAEAVEAAIRSIDRNEIKVIARSRLYRSTAWPNPADPEFVNAVVAVETTLTPAALLTRLHAVEAEFGRIRHERNAPRTLDLDVVDYDGRISPPDESPILPHPRLAERAFVLLPLQEIAPAWRHPVTGATIEALVAALADPSSASPLTP